MVDFLWTSIIEVELTDIRFNPPPPHFKNYFLLDNSLVLYSMTEPDFFILFLILMG